MMSKDYHDYVFRDGKLVGDFDAMYRESEEVPWHQDVMANRWFSDLAVRVLENGGPYGTLVEIGCGLGYFISSLNHICACMTGTDVSKKAIEDAKRKFPHIKFQMHDIRSKASQFSPFDLVVAKDLFWYVYPELETVVANLNYLTKRKLFIYQSFPCLDIDFIGKDVIPNPDTLVEILNRSGFVIEYSCSCQEHLRPQDGPMFMALFRKKE